MRARIARKVSKIVTRSLYSECRAIHRLDSASSVLSCSVFFFNPRKCTGSDIYLFGRGAGKDTISAYDGEAGKLVVIELGADVLSSDLTLKREGNALVLSINASSDKLRVSSYFTNDATYG